MIYPPKPMPGDRVAVLSLSGGLPELFPLPHELGLRRLREDLGLIPVEYPTTRVLRSRPADRAADLHAALLDPTIKAVLATIGGSDQLTVLPHVDRDLLRACPKPFFGFSDNTNLLTLLWEVGVVGYHGGSVMVHLGRPGELHPTTAASLRAALFDSGSEYFLPELLESRDVDLDWADPTTFAASPMGEPTEGWRWFNPASVVTGRTWGGCVEVLAWLLMADRCIPSPGALDGGVLLLETSEELPRADDVYWTLRSMGERGLLTGVAAVMVARAKAWSLQRQTVPSERVEYRAAQREAVLQAIGEYIPGVMVVMDVDFGHTDPQLIVPHGGMVRIDGPARQISVRY